MICFVCNAQTDSVFVGNSIYTGNVKVFLDRVSFENENGLFVVPKEKVKSIVIKGNSYTNAQIKFEDFGQYKDFKYYLKDAATYGIISTCLVSAGAILAGVGAALNKQEILYAGSITAGTGTAFLFPTFIYVFKAAKTKNYKLITE
ncbi:MAG: hypothetical protein KF706_07290 [Chitinophagales bacterium]|nr:hypothetical protein [Chitinophagales bacterium]OJV25697.1 MAG: hypothetical protein BGO32_01430 [Bacteroidetes bacterium 37-13]HRN95637.1 hypothetical protein [Chitinophagales bacterium]HRP38306.1 hypothetical protein [Chitinophagales bacterium]